MATVQIVVDVAGEAAGTPGESRTFAYTKIDPTPPLVTLSIDDTTGITSYEWSIYQQPEGATAELSSTTDAEPTFTPTASVAGTYLISCTVNGGTIAYIGLAFLTEHLSLRKPAPTETTQFSTTRGWEVALAGLMDEVDILGRFSEDAKGARRRAVLDIVDCTAAPPTEVTGNRYILDFTGGTVNAAWDGASKGDVVEFGGVTWNNDPPNEGWVAYVDAKNTDYRYVDDGTPAWEQAAADGQRRRAVIDIVDCTAEPPTTSEGDRYILDTTVGTIHGDWDGAARNDIVELVGSDWVAETPIEGWTVYVDDQDADYRFVDDGTGSWETVNEGREAVFPDNHIWIDADNGSDSLGDGTNALPFATLAAACASVTAPTDFAEYSTKLVFHVGPGTYAAAVTIPRRLHVTIIGIDVVITGTITRNYRLADYFAENPSSYVNHLIISSPVPGGITIYDIVGKNEVNTTDSIDDRYLTIENAWFLGDILNEESGATSSGNDSGTLHLALIRSKSDSSANTKHIGGLRESASSGEEPNAVAFNAWDSTVYHTLGGCIDMETIVRCVFYNDVDYRIDPSTGSGGYSGRIGGSNYGDGLFDTQIVSNKTIKFGWDGVVGEQPEDLMFDAFSLTAFIAGSMSFDNWVSYLRQESAIGVFVDSSGWSGNLGSEESVQAALDTLDGLAANPPIYDDTTVFTDVAASGGTSTVELDIGAIDDGICQVVYLQITSGSSTNTTIQLYNADPSGGGSIIYEVPNYDLVAAVLDDRNCWYVELPTTGELWAKITNDGGSLSSYSMRLRVKGDA